MLFTKKVSESGESLVYILHQSRYFLTLVLLPLVALVLGQLNELFTSLAGLFCIIAIVILIIDVIPLYIKMLAILLKGHKIQMLYEFEGKKKFLFGSTKMTISWTT